MLQSSRSRRVDGAGGVLAVRREMSAGPVPRSRGLSSIDDVRAHAVCARACDVLMSSRAGPSSLLLSWAAAVLARVVDVCGSLCALACPGTRVERDEGPGTELA